MKTMLLTEADVKRLLSTVEVMEAVELAFAEKGLKRVQMPPKQFVDFKNYNGDMRTMPAYLEGLDISAVKVASTRMENRLKHNLPTFTATIVVTDSKNGLPVAMMGGTWISNISTGAAGGVAAKYLARKNARIVGLVGAGAQARTQLMALCAVYEKLEEVRIWSQSKETRKDFVDKMTPICKNVSRMVPVERAENAAQDADIVVTATPSRTPIVLDDWIAPGTHLNCVGADAPGKQELDPAVLKRAKVAVDDLEQASHGGEINVPLRQGLIKSKDVYGELGEIVAGLKKGRASDDEVTVFVSSGVAMLDAVAANVAYKKALAHGVGQFIELM